MPVTGRVALAAIVLAIATSVLVPSSVNAAPDVSPDKFREISTGVALVKARKCNGTPLGQGTGFLVGSSVVMTARHVLKGACRLRVRVNGRNYFGTRSADWFGSGASPSAADLSTVKLDRATTDAFIFRVRSAPVRVGLNLGMAGYPLGNRISFNQGKIIGRGKVGGAPVLAVRMLGAEGASGAPFVDDRGRVVGVLQVGLSDSTDFLGQRTAGALMGLDLVRWWGPRTRLDLCRAYPNGGIAGCPGAAPTDCETRDARYLGKIGGPWTRFVNRWTAWIDAGNPPDASVLPAMDALEGLAIRSVEQQHLACSGGAKRVATLLRGLLPLIDRIEAALDQVPPDSVEVDSLTTLVDVRLDEVEAELALLGFFRGGG